jgi:hypothetical protein
MKILNESLKIRTLTIDMAGPGDGIWSNKSEDEDWLAFLNYIKLHNIKFVKHNDLGNVDEGVFKGTLGNLMKLIWDMFCDGTWKEDKPLDVTNEDYMYYVENFIK